jgi:hypothetical protein
MKKLELVDQSHGKKWKEFWITYTKNFKDQKDLKDNVKLEIANYYYSPEAREHPKGKAAATAERFSVPEIFLKTIFNNCKHWLALKPPSSSSSSSSSSFSIAPHSFEVKTFGKRNYNLDPTRNKEFHHILITRLRSKIAFIDDMISEEEIQEELVEIYRLFDLSDHSAAETANLISISVIKK